MPTHAAFPSASTGFYAMLFGRDRDMTPPAASDGAEENRARRAFVQEALSRNADAFRSAEDVQAMMGHFPGEF